MTERVLVDPGPTMLGTREVVGGCFVTGEIVAVRLTVPLKPFKSVIVTRKLAVEPVCTV